jgi:hypothetical protein
LWRAWGEEKGKGSGVELAGGETEAGAPLYRAGRRWRGGEAVTGNNGVSMLRTFWAMGRQAPVSRVNGMRRTVSGRGKDGVAVRRAGRGGAWCRRWCIPGGGAVCDGRKGMR